MLQESVFTTLDLPSADRFEAWVERMSQTHAPLHLTSDHASDYRVHQRVITLGEVTVWPATFDPLVFIRTPRLVRQSDPESYHLSLLLKGEGAADWGRHQAAYGIQDFHVNSSSRSWEVLTGAEPVTILGIEIPRALVALPRHRADLVVGRRLSARDGIGALLAQFLHQLTADTAAYRPADGARLGTVVADLITALFGHALDADTHLTPEAHDRTLVLHLKAHIRRHLADPGLTPARIAAAHHISRSHLYRLFQGQGLGVASTSATSGWNAPAATSPTPPCAPCRSTPSPPAGASPAPPSSPAPSAPPTATRRARPASTPRAVWTLCQRVVDPVPTTAARTLPHPGDHRQPHGPVHRYRASSAGESWPGTTAPAAR